MGDITRATMTMTELEFSKGSQTFSKRSKYIRHNLLAENPIQTAGKFAPSLRLITFGEQAFDLSKTFRNATPVRM